MSIVYHNVAGTSGGSTGVSYELIEQDTGLKYHDGRAIYQKTYDAVWDGSTGDKTMAHGITNLDSVIRFVSGHAHEVGGGQLAIPRISTSLTTSGIFFYTWDETNLVGYIGTDFININRIEFTIQYVKTA